MHARFYSPTAGKFLSVDPVIPASSLGNPQRWNRYAYVMNNPMRWTDPTGTDIVLSGCVKDASSSTCSDQLSAAQTAFGKAWSQVNYNNGVIRLKAGVSPSGLGGEFGSYAHALGFMANSKDHFTLIADAAKAAQGNGAFTDPVKGGGANIYYDPAKLGGGRTMVAGGVNVSLGEALAHETGHSIEQYFANVGSINSDYAANVNTYLRREAFPVFLENNWRQHVMGPGADIRRMYSDPHDLHDGPDRLESIWP
jgi:hypothetical protein